MKLLFNPNHESRDTYLGDWERVAFYNLVTVIHERLLIDPAQIEFTFSAEMLKRVIDFEQVVEDEYTDRLESKFAYNDDHRKDGVIDQLFDLIGHSLNYGMELREPERSTRFSPFSFVGISLDFGTFTIGLNSVFRRLILEHYTLVIYHEWIKAGLTDPGALEIFEAIAGHPAGFSMTVPIEEDEYETIASIYSSGIAEINTKTIYRLHMEPINGGESLEIKEAS